MNKLLLNFDAYISFYVYTLKPSILRCIDNSNGNYIGVNIHDGSVIYSEPSDKTNIIRFVEISHINGFPIFEYYPDTFNQKYSLVHQIQKIFNTTILNTFKIQIANELDEYTTHSTQPTESDKLNDTILQISRFLTRDTSHLNETKQKLIKLMCDEIGLDGLADILYEPHYRGGYYKYASDADRIFINKLIKSDKEHQVQENKNFLNTIYEKYN